MNYNELASLISLPVASWELPELAKWLSFLHLDALIPNFSRYHIDGSMLLSMEPKDLNNIGINSKIIVRKLMRWIKEGLSSFDNCLMDAKLNCNKISYNPRLHRLDTSHMRGPLRSQQKSQAASQIYEELEEKHMIIKSYEGVQTDFYLVNHAPISVGRSTNSVIRSLEITVEDRHAQVFESAGRYYLQDLGTESGTFVKISLRQALKVGTLIEMGSFMFKVKAMDKAFQAIQLSCYHIVNKTLNDLTIIFKNNEPYTFGRRASNHFSSEDEHMSGQHAQMYFSKGEFYMEDNQSTNGTWVRLSDRRVVSEPYYLNDWTVFKIGSTITYVCQIVLPKQQRYMELDYNPACTNCNYEPRNCLSLPCRHNMLCGKCAQGISHCIACHQKIESNILIYLCS